MTPGKILVTGATGFIGSRLCEQLTLDHKLPYRALVRNFARAARIARLSPEMVAGNLNDAHSLDRAVEGCDYVINLAHADDLAAASQTRKLVAACRQHKVKRLVHVSSMAVHGPQPGVPVVSESSAPIRRWGEAYSDAKAEAEALVLAASRRGDLPAVVIRPTVVYGPASFFVTPIIDDARRGLVSLVDGGMGRCNAVYVDDVCAAAMTALQQSAGAIGKAYLVNGDDDLSWHDFIFTFATMVEGPHSVYDHSRDDIRAHWAAQRPGLLGSLKAAARLAASPAFHAQLSTVPPVGGALRAIKERLARVISQERKVALKVRFQGRPAPAISGQSPPPKVPSLGRVVREGYAARVSNELAKQDLGWRPLFDFAAGAERTRAWLAFSRLI